MIEVEVCEVLNKAADILETEGWIQGAYYRKDEGYCILGAIAKASGYCDFAVSRYKNYNQQILANKAVEVVGKSLGTSYVSHVWNDSPERTKEEVISTLRGLCADQEIPQPELQIRYAWSG